MFPITNTELQNLRADTVASAISDNVVKAATRGDRKYIIYINRAKMMTYRPEDMQRLMDKLEENFPEAAITLHLLTQGKQRTISLSDLTLLLVSYALGEEARIVIRVDWSKE